MYTVAFDTETKGFDWWGDQTAFIITAADAEREYCFNVDDGPDSPGAQDFRNLARRADVLVAHNLSFDVHQVRSTIGFDLLTDVEAALHDTDLMARVAWPEATWDEHGGFKLEALTEHFLGRSGKAGKEAIEAVAKDLGIKLSETGGYYKVWLARPDVMEHYAKVDARDTLDLYDRLTAEFEGFANSGDGRAEIYATEQRVCPILIRGEARGTRLSPPAVAALKRDYKDRERRLHASLSKQLGDVALGGEGSQDGLIEALLMQGVPLHRMTDSGDKLSTSKYALQEFERDYPVVAEYLEYRTVEKFLSTYIGPMEGREVIHPSIRQIGAWTGRMSCMRPNMQNIPVRAGSEVRECYVARPGYKLLVADYEQIEARVVAYYLGPEGKRWRDLINAGEDVHAHMATDLANRGIEPWRDAVRVVTQDGRAWTPADFDKHGVNGKLRSAARHTLFAILYGAGAVKICDQLGLPTGPPLTADDWVVKKGYKEVGQPSGRQGKAVIDGVKASVPGYAKFARRVRNKVEADGFVTTMLGRYQAMSKDKGYVGIAALAQGTAADVMKAALIAADPVIQNHGGSILMVVHDEILAEVPEQQAEAALAGMRHAMETAVDSDPPFLTSGVICDNYGEAK